SHCKRWERRGHGRRLAAGEAESVQEGQSKWKAHRLPGKAGLCGPHRPRGPCGWCGPGGS
ncbi:ARRB1 isoform 9, partial [Pan troglodytes]